MSVKFLLRIFLFGILLLITVSASAQQISSCTLSTVFNDIRLRSGPSTSNQFLGVMRPRTSFQVLARVDETLTSGVVRTWYRLIPSEVMPNTTVAEIWVGGQVTTSGDCNNIVVSGQPVVIQPETPNATPVVRSGIWRYRISPAFYNVTCTNGIYELIPITLIRGEYSVVATANSINIGGFLFTLVNGQWVGESTIDGVTYREFLTINSDRSMTGRGSISVQGLCTSNEITWTYTFRR